MKEYPSLSVIICTYNRSTSLKTTLASLAQLDPPVGFRWELIVVDNNSKDDTAIVVRDFEKNSGLEVRYLFEAMQGLSHARNRGVREASGEIIVFTDDDVIVDKFWLTQLATAFQESGCMAAGGKTVPLWPKSKPRWFDEKHPQAFEGVFVQFDLGDRPCEATRAPFGANMAFRKAAFLKYGLFRTDLGRCGELLMSWEDSEFFSRLMARSEKVYYVPDAIVYHPVAPERTQKSYAQSVFFHNGKSQFRVTEIPEGTIIYFGVPRYLLRKFVERFVAWILSFQTKKRFRKKLLLYQTAGMIAESLQSTTHSKKLSLLHPKEH